MSTQVLFPHSTSSKLTHGSPWFRQALPTLGQWQSLSFPSRILLFATVLIRAILFSGCAWFCSSIVDVGSSFFSLTAVAVTGISLGTLIAFSKLRFFALLVGHIGMVVGALCLLSIIEFLRNSFAEASFFAPHIAKLHFEILSVYFACAFLSTWAFWKISWYAFFEAIIISSLLLLFFAGHQNFHFDSPQIVNSWAWELGLGNVRMLSILGATATGLALFLFATPLLPHHPRHQLLRATQRSSQGKVRPFATLAAIAVVTTLVFLVTRAVGHHYEEMSSTLVANGVGMDSSEGLSPLGFHSALGSTNQPSALVRMDSDYPDNPFTPMLYFRESALSAFNGHEMVRAPAPFDDDAYIGAPGSRFEREEDSDLVDRLPLRHSVYTLTKHENAFGIDYPINTVPLKNPKPDRFLSTYQVYSLAPHFRLEDLLSTPVGDPRWTSDIRQHYLTPHPDVRYGELAERITAAASSPGEKTKMIIDYLSKNSIYTLTPNHDVGEKEDPVAPYLFGDMRGYCVHFSHATVYMLRALGIPSRIGTGYLTDLSQAKDGHVLLRMSDRHAWAEVYFQGVGWVPMDTQPANVESHANTDMDMGLLEELMGILGPDEELLPDELTKDEPGVEEESSFELPSSRWLLFPFFGFFLIAYAGKFWLRRGFRFAKDDRQRAFRLYRALISHYIDIGQGRRFGETLKEYQARLMKDLDMRVLSLTPHILEGKYSQGTKQTLSVAAAEEIYRGEIRDRKGLSQSKRLLSLFHLRSIAELFFTRKW